MWAFGFNLETLQQTVCIRSTQITLLYQGFDSVLLKMFFSDLIHEKIHAWIATFWMHICCSFVYLFFFPLEGFALCFPGNHAWNKGKDLFYGKGILLIQWLAPCKIKAFYVYISIHYELFWASAIITVSLLTLPVLPGPLCCSPWLRRHESNIPRGSAAAVQ